MFRLLSQIRFGNISKKYLDEPGLVHTLSPLSLICHYLNLLK
ncbi:hypothetical protein GCWU000323_02020 [Leptotrichia hofstadii F0254]|uniref:Uncharacterized protein n=1 Tax=Leptotrichia hofstadii F0254 TaxID=634994 RepID=C9MZQ0_9FUSO|nr:hypothetical protein GCWU000323_02020 [Leptotrichia hofstadii F0254]